MSGPVIEDVFADKALLEDTLDRLLGADPKLPLSAGGRENRTA